MQTVHRSPFRRRASSPLARVGQRAFRPTLVCAALLVLAACGEETGDAMPAGEVARDSAALSLSAQDVAVADMKTIGDGISLSGTLEPKESATVRAQVDGTIAELRVDRGSPVRRGQRIATLNAAGVVSRAAGARASVAAARANLSVVKKQLDAAIRLHAAGAISDVDRQTAEATYEASQSQLAAAQAQLAGADEQAGYTAIVAPFNGVVSARPRQRGENVRVGDEILTIVNSDVLELAGQIGVADAGRVRIGQPVEFALDAFASEAFRGRVARMDPVADAGTRQVGVYIELANSKGRIVGGQFARGRIQLGETRAIVIPANAVRDLAADGNTGSVFVIREGRAVKRAVTLGARDNASGMIAVLTGVEAGEQVIVTQSAELTEGLRVTVGADADRPAPATVPPTPSPAKE